MFIAGDIGGTKTKLAVYPLDSSPRAPLFEKTYPSQNYPSFELILRDFFQNLDAKVERACFGVAGPVVGGRSQVTNLPWVVDTRGLEEALGIGRVFLLNDLEAIANAVPFLEDDDIWILNPGEVLPEGALAVIAPGTGLGEAFLTWDGDKYIAHPSEGGHANFGPSNSEEMELWNYLYKRYGHVSYERVCSGSGIPNIYQFLKETGKYIEPPWLAEKLSLVTDPTPMIATTALDPDKDCPLCEATLNTFVSILGAEASNFALEVLATGGVYLGGGIPPKIIPKLKEPTFMKSFANKGRFSALAGRLRVSVIMNNDAALLGAACYGLSHGDRDS
jgi:glucokinase